MLIASVYVFFLVPETKGVPLEAMDRLFSREWPARKAHKAVLEELRIQDQDFRRLSIHEEKSAVEQREDSGVEKV